MKKKILEDYLKTIYILSLDRKKIENEDIALILETEQSEVQKNIDELIRKGYILYDDENHRFDLTDKGLEIAKKTYKKHELFEDFFKKIINIGHNVAHVYSDVLEHLSDESTEKKFEDILKYYDHRRNIVPITFLEKGDVARLVRIERDYCSSCKLYELGLCGNCEIKVLEESSQKGPMKIKVRGSELSIDYEQAKNIFVEHKTKDMEQWTRDKERWKTDYRKKWGRKRYKRGKKKKIKKMGKRLKKMNMQY